MKNPRHRGGHRGLVTSLSLGGVVPDDLFPHDLHGGGSLDPDSHVIRGDSFDLDPDRHSIDDEPNPFAESPSQDQHPCISSMSGSRGLRDRATLYGASRLRQAENIPDFVSCHSFRMPIYLIHRDATDADRSPNKDENDED